MFAAAAASPPEAMLALASDPDPAIRAQALAELANWPDDPTPVADADLPAERLERLASCHLVWVRVGVAANPGTGPDTLARLTADPDPHVLAALARIIDLPAALLIQLARTPDPNVQAELRRNPSAEFLYSPVPPAGPLPTAPTDLTTTTPADHPQSPAPTGGAPDLVTVGGPPSPRPGP